MDKKVENNYNVLISSSIEMACCELENSSTYLNKIVQHFQENKTVHL